MSTGGQDPRGVGVEVPAWVSAQEFEVAIDAVLAELGLAGEVQSAWLASGDRRQFGLRLGRAGFDRWCPGYDTLSLASQLASFHSSWAGDALLREAWVALLAAPVRIDFDSLEELQAHVRARCHIARAAEKTALAFKTNDAAERPEAFWRYEEDVGFLLQPQAGLIDALIAATQPERTGRLYDFSCYRASEYVILLGLAQEARHSDPELYDRLERSARDICIKSGRFHEVFLTEYGTVDAPIPPRYYVPGDRVWFKNPDEASSNASGYEGSWVIYMGGGLFSNFWKRDRPYTLEEKALEVFHWRDGLYLDAAREPQIDEGIVEACMVATGSDPVRRSEVLERMSRYRDPTGVYASGGCIDASREFPRPLHRISLD